MATAIVSAANAAELTAKELALVDMGAAIARGEQDKLVEAFKAGFAAGLTLNEAKEVVGQLYAYCGFPRALNAAATLMEVAKDDCLTQRRGEAEGAERIHGGSNRPGGPFLLGDKALEIGSANQTKLCGREVKGPLFDFHPQLDEYLKAHLFGDIFQRDMLDWRTRELVTIAALAARPEPSRSSRLTFRLARSTALPTSRQRQSCGACNAQTIRRNCRAIGRLFLLASRIRPMQSISRGEAISTG